MTLTKLKYGASVAVLALALTAGTAHAADQAIENGGTVADINGGSPGVTALSSGVDSVTYTDNDNGGTIGFTFESSVDLVQEGTGESINGTEGANASTTADTVTFTLGDGVGNNGAVTINLAGAVFADGNGNGQPNADTINFTFDGEDAHTLTIGAGGDDTHHLGAAGIITMANAGDSTTIDGDITLSHTQFNADAALILTANTNYTGDVDSTLGGDGTLTFQGTSVFSGTIGAGAAVGSMVHNSTDTVEIQGATVQVQTIDLDGAGTTEFSGASAAITSTSGIDLAGGHTMDLSGANQQVNGDINSSDNSGILDINGASATINGNVGNTNNLATVTVDTAGSVEFQGTLNADTITLEGNGAITLGAGSSVVSLNGVEDTDDNGSLTVDGDGTISFNGNIGGTNGIAALDITTSDTLNFTGAGTTINAAAITLDGTLQISTTGTTTVSGVVGSTGGSAGALNLDQTTIFDGDVGQNAGASIATMSISTGDTVTFTTNVSDVNIDVVTVEGTGQVTFAGGVGQTQNFTGTILSDGSGNGQINVDKDLTFVGNIGSATPGQEFTTVDVGASGAVTYTHQGDIYSDAITINAGATLAMEGTRVITSSNGVIGGADGVGIFDVSNGTSTVTLNGNLGTTAASLATVSVGNDDTLIVSGASLDATNFTIDGELNLTGATVSVVGDVDSTGGSAGVLDVDGDTTFAGNVGSAQSLATLEVADNMTVILQGATNQIDAVTLEGATGSILQFAGAGGTFTGGIDSDASANGIVDIDATTVFAATSTMGAVNGVAGVQVATGVDMDVRTSGTFSPGQITLEGTGEIIFGASNVTINATDTDSDGSGTGVITVGAGFTGNALAGDVGAANGIATVAIGAGSALELSGTTINATALTLADATSAVRFSGNGAAIGIANLNGGGDAVFDGGGTQTFTGVIGNGTALDVLEVSNTTTLAVSANVSTANITIEDASTLQVTGTTTLVGDIDSTTTDTLGILDLDGDVTIAGDIGATDILGTLDVDAAGSLITGGNTIAATNFNVNGDIDMSDSVVLGAGTTLAFADGSSIVLSGTTLAATNAETTNSTYIDADTNNATVTLPNGTVDVRFTTGYTGTVDLVDANGGTLTDNGVTFNTSNAGTLVNVDFLVVTDERVTMTVSEKPNQQLATELGVSAGEADGLFAADDAITTGNDAGARTALDTVIAAGGNAAKTAAQQVTFDVQTSVASTTATGNMVRTNTNVGQRLANTRSGGSSASSRQGFASGNGIMRDSFWFQGFGQTAEQDDRDGVAGFDADTFGGTMGFDRQVTSKSRVGVALGYANTEVDGKGAGDNNTEIDSYQLSVYGDYTRGNYFLEGSVGYAYNDADTSSVINFGGLDRRLTGDYEASQYSASVTAGFSKALTKTVKLVPTAGLLYTFVEGDEFTLTDSTGGAFTQDVDIDDTHVLLGKVGATLKADMKARNGATWSPEFRANVLYDFIGDEAESTSTFTSNGATYRAEGADIAETSVNVGAGFTYTVPNKMMDFTADYDAELKEDFTSHTGVVKARFKF